MVLVIMAAGLGSRFGGLKQLEKIDDFGNFLIDYSIFDAICAGFDEVVFIIKKENYSIFENTIGKRVKSKIKTSYVFQENDDIIKNYPRFLGRQKPLGTGYAIFLLKDKIKENFAVINADDFYGRESFFKLGEFLKTNKNFGQFALMTYDVINTLSLSGEVKRGVCEIKDNKLLSITECKIKKVDNDIFCENLLSHKNMIVSETAKVSMNMFGFTPKIFEFLSVDFEKFLNSTNIDPLTSEFFLPNVVTSAIAKGQCEATIMSTSCKWLGLTYSGDLKFVKSEILKLNKSGIYKGIDK